MTADAIRKTILDGLKSDRVRWWGSSMVPPALRFREQRERWRLARKRAGYCIYDYRPAAWAGRDLTARELRQFRAELERMQDDGLVKLEFGRRRIVRVQLLNMLMEAPA
jgi:hypothetical protein